MQTTVETRRKSAEFPAIYSAGRPFGNLLPRLANFGFAEPEAGSVLTEIPEPQRLPDCQALQFPPDHIGRTRRSSCGELRQQFFPEVFWIVAARLFPVFLSIYADGSGTSSTGWTGQLEFSDCMEDITSTVSTAQEQHSLSQPIESEYSTNRLPDTHVAKMKHQPLHGLCCLFAHEA